jgi:AraC family transcriptional regulator
MAGVSGAKSVVIGVNTSAAVAPHELDVPLAQDRDLSLFCCHPTLGPAAEHAHKQLEIAVLFEPAACAVSWPLAGGRRGSARVTGPGVVVVAPGQLHACAWEHTSDVILMHLERRLQRRLLPQGLADVVVAPGCLAHDGVLWQLAGGLRGLCLKKNARDIAFLPMVAQCVVARAVELLGTAPVPALRRLTDVQLRTVQELVRTKLAHEIHAEDLARCVGLCVQYFNALFKNTVGLTPAEYIFECRMQKAEELLRTGRYKISAVARLVGFFAAGYFTARFRAHFGVSPRALIDQSRAFSSVPRSFSSERR